MFPELSASRPPHLSAFFRSAVLSRKAVPVRRVLLLDGGNNEAFHLLVRLGHQVNRGALLHDGYVLLERLADHLTEANGTVGGFSPDD